jgi:NAD(P)H-hydrate repair Nnr-like enzyme with NAD(P)H-hydrate dehydratase domain
MASGGMGDVLTGMIAGFIAQGYDCARSAQLAVFCHGLAGDLLSREQGPLGFMAGDLLRVLPRALRALSEHRLPASLDAGHASMDLIL